MRTNSSLPTPVRSDLNQNIHTSEQKTKGNSFLRGIKSLFSKNKTATDSSINNAEKKLGTQKSGGEKAAAHVSMMSNQTVNIRSAVPTSFTLPPTDILPPPPMPPVYTEFDTNSPPPKYGDIFPDQKSASPPPPSDLPPPPPAPTDKPPPPQHSITKMTTLELKREALSKALNKAIPAETSNLRRLDKNQLIGKINNAIPFEKLNLNKDHKNFNLMKEKMDELHFSIEFFCASAAQDNDITHKFTDEKIQGLKEELINDFSSAYMLTTNNSIANPELTNARASLAALLDNVIAKRNDDPW
jgi:hypothetical protein